MIMKMYSVFDAKSLAYLLPMFYRANGEAIRAFSDAATVKDHNFFRFAEDYTLFEVGEFNDSDCTFTLLKSPIPLGNALEFKSQATSG